MSEFGVVGRLQRDYAAVFEAELAPRAPIGMLPSLRLKFVSLDSDSVPLCLGLILLYSGTIE